MLTIAVDFDGTLCQYAFPEIGEQTFLQKKLMEILIKLRSNGNKLILWTNRGDNEEYKVLSEAIQWCKNKGLEFDSINENLPNQKKLSGYSPKIMADYYIDDKALVFSDLSSQQETLEKLSNLIKVNNIEIS
jgi:hypothetical protein